MRPRRHVASFPTLLAALLVIVSAALIPAPRTLFAFPAPSISITSNSFAPLGQQTTFTLTFQNTGTQTGYGPFLDLVFPATGADGDDGLRFVNATYLGTALETRTLTFPPSGCVQHPFARLTSGDYQQVCGTPGDTLVVLRLPFGSFTPEQPAINISVVGQIDNRADLDYPLTVRTRTGFQFGATPLNDWCCDPLLLSEAQGQPGTNSATWTQQATVTPTLINLPKTYNGPENETATGPNFPRSYTLSADIATGQLVRNLVITDTLPNNLAFLNLVSSSPAHSSLVTPPVGVPNNPPNNQLAVGYPDILGGTGSNDASATFSFFATRLDANGNPVLDPSTGLAVTTPNNLRASYSWTPLDPRDEIVTATIDLPGPEHTLTLRSLAVQKGVTLQNDTGAPGFTPGDTVEYSLQLQVSDFFAFDQVLLTDVMDDGLRLDPSYTPRLQVNGNGYSLTASIFDAANYTVDTSQIGNDSNPATDGSTRILFRVSDELVTRGQNARLVGGCIDPINGSNPPNCGLYNDGPTTATIVFRAIIQDSFSDTYPSGDASVDEGDVLGNRVTASGRVLNSTTASFTPTANTVSDTSSANLNIQRGTIAKTIYALNGNTSLPNPFEVTAGDVVTYRLRTTLPSSDIERLRLVDYLPLPIFSASEVTTFDPTFPGTGVPPAGTVAYGPGHTLSTIAPSLVPTMTVSVLGNSVEFNYGSFDDPLNRPSTIDLLLSVTVSDRPTADGLFITNQLRRFSGATNTPDAADDAIVQIKITQPVLLVSKGVIGTDNPGAIYTAPIGPTGFTGPGSPLTSTGLATTPVDADVSGVDANDRVSFAIVLENIGSGTRGAFDIAIRDFLPPGLVIPPGGINLQAHTGAGVAKSLTFLGPSGTASDLFTNGVQLVDDTDLGACQKFDPTSGANIIVLTYDLLVDPNITPGTPVLNRGTLTSYAATEGGTNHVGAGSEPFDRASVTARIPTLSKAILATSEAHTPEGTADTLANPRPLAIGEVVTFTLAYSIPEGLSSSLLITDTLPSGMIYVANSARVAFVSSATSTLTSNTLSGAGLNLVGSDPNVVATFALPPAAVSGGTGSGVPVRFSLGDLRNSDNDSDDEFVVVQFGAVLDNTMGGGGIPRNVAGTNLSNSALASTSSLLTPISSGSVHMRVLEPSLTISKEVVEPSPALADAGDVVTYTVTITNASGPNATTAFDLLLDDTLPVSVTLDAGSLSASGSAGASGLVTSVAGNTANLNLSALEPGATATFTYSVALREIVTPGELITNTARVRYTSLPGEQGTANATPGAPGSNSGERSGFVTSPAAPNDRYRHTASATLIVFEPAPFKELVATSEPHTLGTNVTIGEVVTFRLSVRLAEGTSPNLQLRDPLPRGLNYITNTARVALVSANPTLLTSSTLSGAGLHLAGNDPNISPSFALPAGAVSLSGDTVTFSLGTITNAESDPDSEFVVLTFQAVVDNEGTANAANSNDAGEVLSNTFTMLVNGVASTPSNAVTMTIVEPQLSMTKARTSPNNPDAGDITAYTITITNANSLTSAIAFDSVITESLHPNLLLDPASISLTIDGSPASFSGLISSANGFSLTLPDLNPGQVARLSFTTTVADTVIPNQLLTNVTTLRYTSLPGPNGTANATPGAPGTGTGERTGSGGVNDYAQSRNSNHNSLDLGRTKYANQTSEPDTISGGTNPPNLVIGEVARFRIAARIPEGNTPVFQMIDDLPDGLVYLDGTARIAFVANQGGLSSTTITPALPGCSGLNVTGGTTLGTNTPTNTPDRTNLTCPIVPTVSTITGFTRYTFDLGDITNADRDSDNEYIIIDFEARVSNVTANQAGLVLTNGFRTALNNGTPSGATNRTVRIAEPAITLSQTRVGSGPVDAGDVVTYTVTITNTGSTSSASASDVLVQVPLPPGLGSPSLVGSATSTGTALTVTTSLPGNVPTMSIGRLQAQNSSTTSTATFTFTAVVQDLALAGQTITTTATATYTSLPGTAGTTPAGITAGTRGTPGAADGERIGIANDPLNDYILSADATVELLTPTISKALASGANATPTIGELLTYTLSITLPEGTTEGLVVTDTLPLGLAYLADSVSVDAPNYGVGTLIITATGGEGDPVIINFPGPIEVSGDNNPTNNGFTINLTARVLNVIGNQQGVTRTNTAALRFSDPESGPTAVNAPTPVTITVTEPVLALAKTVFTPPNPADGGNVVEYELVLSHATDSGGTAYAVVFTDTLPANLTPYEPTTVSVNATGITAPAYAYSGTTLRIPETGSLDLPPGATITVRYRAMVGAGVTAGETITNTAGVVWRSLPASGFERSGGPSGAPDGENFLGSGALDDYEIQAQASFVIDLPNLTKTLLNSSASHTSDPNLTIGETATYQIEVKVPQAVIPSMELSEFLPDGLSVQSVSVDYTGFGGGTLAHVLNPATLPAPSGTDVSLTWPAFTNPTDGDPDNNVFTVTLVARVVDQPSNQNGTVLTNTAALRLGGGPPIPSNPVAVTVIVPELALSKAFDQATALAGASLQVTLNLTNTGSSDAFGTIFTDTLSKDWFAAAPTPTAPSGLTVSVVDTTNAWLVVYSLTDPLAAGASVSANFAVNLRSDLFSSTPLVINTAIATGRSLPGGDPTARTVTTGPADATVQVIAPDLAITKTGPASINPGTTLSYSLHYTNTGDVALTGIVITETVPDQTSFNATSSTAGWSCADGSVAGTSCTFTVGNLALAANGSVIFAVDVPAIVPAGLDVIANTVSIADNGASGPERTTSNNSSSVNTPLDAAPELAISLERPASLPVAGQPLSFTFAYTNSGSQGATGVVVTLTVPLETRFLPSDNPGLSWNCDPLPSGDPASTGPGATCTTTLGALAVGQSGSGVFTVRVNNPFNNAGLDLRATATIRDDGANGSETTYANNSASAGFQYTPTAITLMGFTAIREANGIRLNWATGSELNTAGFWLLRGPTADPTSAAPLEAAGFIKSEGDLVGAAYTYLDTEAGLGQTYFYWLVEVERDGTETRYGPVMVTAPGLNSQLRVFLPVIGR